MERILSVAQMRANEQFNIDKLGVPEKVLIERAGLAVADEIIKRLKGGRVLVCVGKGNNGADGVVIADILSRKHGFSVARINVSNGIFKMFDKKYDIIVDCIFGTGLNKEIGGKYKEAIEKINESGAFVVACDIPSGLNADTGNVMGCAVKANLTVAIQEYKLGHFLNDGPDFCGETIVKDIGISIWGDDEFAKRFNDNDLVKFFPKRKRNVHKGSFPSVALMGGSKMYSGSILLSKNALTALKTGCGKSYLCVPESVYKNYIGIDPECILMPFPDRNGFIEYNETELEKLLACDCIAVGPGMGCNRDTYNIISFLLKNFNGRLLIDADGINALAMYGNDILKEKKCEVLLTPHIGEFSRISLTEKPVILSDIIYNAKQFAEKYGVVLLLKSAVSVITDGKEVYINTSGTNGLAKAGSGDVLTGLTAGFLAKRESLIYCSAAAAYMFGKAGERAVEKLNEYTVTATDVIASLSEVINML